MAKTSQKAPKKNAAPTDFSELEKLVTQARKAAAKARKRRVRENCEEKNTQRDHEGSRGNWLKKRKRVQSKQRSRLNWPRLLQTMLKPLRSCQGNRRRETGGGRCRGR